MTTIIKKPKKVKKSHNITLDKVRGIMLGVAIGDALGMPVEHMSHEEIKAAYPKTNGRIRRYYKPRRHWFKGEKAGSWTDDTQLTLAVADGIIADKGCFDIISHVDHHIKAYKQTTKGWGGSTKTSIKRLINNTNTWHSSGMRSSAMKQTGAGNGVAMKIAPMALLTNKLDITPININNSNMVFALNLCNLCMMTHATQIAVQSTFAHVGAISYLLNNRCFNSDFTSVLITWIVLGNYFVAYENHLTQSIPPLKSIQFLDAHSISHSKDTLVDRISLLNRYEHTSPSIENRIAEMGDGGCYCYDSLPFAYSFFVKKPNSIQCLYDVVSAGGDTDTNGSLVGSLLGALHGTSIFPRHLINGLQDKKLIIDTADKLYDVLKD